MERLYGSDVPVDRKRPEPANEGGGHLFHCKECQVSVPEKEKRAHQTSISHQIAKKRSTVDYFPVSHKSKGYLIMKAQGYELGKGLGKNQEGIVNPINPPIKNDKLGVGAKASSSTRVDKAADDEQDGGIAQRRKRARKKAMQEDERDRKQRQEWLNYLKN
ncbi:MAG: hypothetical protein SGCHY_004268 [Lobulomycetales sp.]